MTRVFCSEGVQALLQPFGRWRSCHANRIRQLAPPTVSEPFSVNLSSGSQSAPDAWPAAFDVIGAAPVEASLVTESEAMVKGRELGSCCSLVFAMAHRIKWRYSP